jgi:sulfur-carrier protein
MNDAQTIGTQTQARQVPARQVTVRYFAWLRERTGVSDERFALPADVVTVGDLMTALQQRGEGFAAAFAHPEAIRAALDRVHVKSNTPIGSAREIGFFPPVTGG